MPVTKLSQMFEILKNADKKRLIAAYANDSHTIEAVHKACEKGLIIATLVGDEEVIRKVCKEENINVNDFTIVHEPIDQKAAERGH